nr:hypothetical protein [Chlamydia muridarum]
MQLTIVNTNSRIFPFSNERILPGSTLSTDSTFSYIKILIPLLAGSICLLLGALILAGTITTVPAIAASYFLSLGVTLVVAGIGLCSVFRPHLFSINQSQDLHIIYY